MEQNLVIKWYTSIDSTNAQAVRESHNAPEGCVWIAEYQTNGRGQRGNVWESSAGKNLTFSLLLKPVFLNPTQQFTISEVISVGICKYLINKGLKPKIKWPNDIYINDKKICGILIENSINGANLSVSVCGVGLNLNQTSFSPNAPNPTSLILESDSNNMQGTTEFSLKEELSLLLTEILSIYNNIKQDSEQIEKLHKEYINNLYRYNQLHNFIEIKQNDKLDMPVEKICNGDIVQGRIIDVTQNGLLVVNVCRNAENQEEIKRYSFKEIRYVI